MDQYPSYPQRIKDLDIECLMSLSVQIDQVNAQLRALRMMGLYVKFDLEEDEDGVIEIKTPPSLFRIFNADTNE